MVLPKSARVRRGEWQSRLTVEKGKDFAKQCQQNIDLDDAVHALVIQSSVNAVRSAGNCRNKSRCRGFFSHVGRQLRSSRRWRVNSFVPKIVEFSQRSITAEIQGKKLRGLTVQLIKQIYGLLRALDHSS